MKLTDATASPFQVKAIDDSARTFSGLANTWEKDLGDDIVHQGAFARTLEHWSRDKVKRNVPLLDWHGWGSVRIVLGKMIEAEETDAGLEATFKVTKGQDGDEVLHRLRDGMLNALSIGYEPVRWEIEQADDGKRVRHLHELKLMEVSLVVWPMNDSSRVDLGTVKSILREMKDGPAAEELRALLSGTQPKPADAPAPAPAPTGLAPDAKEIELLRERARRIKLRSLAR